MKSLINKKTMGIICVSAILSIAIVSGTVPLARTSLSRSGFTIGEVVGS